MKRWFHIMLFIALISLAGCGNAETKRETGAASQVGNAKETTENTADKTATKEESITVNDSEEDFTATMYDYSFAGMKSATKKVDSSDYVSVLEYGVEANSDKDFSEEIIKAIYDAAAKGKYLYFPEGTYFVKNVKIRNTDNVRICGEGEKTILMTRGLRTQRRIFTTAEQGHIFYRGIGRDLCVFSRNEPDRKKFRNRRQTL